MLLAEILEAREDLEAATTEEQVAAIREANHGEYRHIPVITDLDFVHHEP